MRLFPDSARTLSRALVLLLTLLAVLVPVAPLAAHGGDDVTESTLAGHVDSHLESSWPRDGVMLWVPPKEARLTYLEPVNASTLVLALSRTDSELLVEDEVVRLTSGENVTEVLLRLPRIRPGMYELDWSVSATSGTLLQGSIGFGLEPPIAAVGGQNHRHGEAHLYRDTPGQFALRLLFVAAAAFLFAAVRRARTVNGKGALERLLLRVGAGLLILAALITGVVDVTKWVDAYHDKPFSAITAAPGLSILIPVLGFSVFSLVRARASLPVFWCASGSLAAYAGLSHSIQIARGAELFVVFTVLLVTLALVWAEMLRILLAPPPVDPQTNSFAPGRVLSGSALVLVGAALLMLVLHAGTLDLEIAFMRDLRSRLILSVTLLAGLGAFSFLASRPRGLRLLALIPAAVVLVVSALLVWMPPPAAGL